MKQHNSRKTLSVRRYLLALACASVALMGLACGGGGGGGLVDTATQVPSARGWRAPTLIETDNVASSTNVQIAFDTHGNALAVWSQSDGQFTSIWANRFTPIGGWETALLIEAENAGNATRPQIAFDAGGNAIAVWTQSDGVRSKIWTNRYTRTVGWGAAASIQTNEVGNASEPQIAIDASGNALAVWQQGNGAVNGAVTNVWANRFAISTGWATAVLLEQNDAGSAALPQISVAANGNAMAVWQQSDGMRSNVWANKFLPATGWSTPVLIEADDSGGVNNPRVAMNNDGHAFAVWVQSDGTRQNVWSNRYTPSAGWADATVIETDNAGGASFPQIVIDANGAAMSVWMQSDGVRSNIWANRYTTTAGWSTATLIETDNSGDAVEPKVVIDVNGNAMAVWHQYDGTRSNIWANRYGAVSGWATASLIETDNASDALFPRIAMDTDGNAMAAWRQSDGTRFNIWAARFN